MCVFMCVFVYTAAICTIVPCLVYDACAREYLLYCDEMVNEETRERLGACRVSRAVRGVAGWHDPIARPL